MEEEYLIECNIPIPEKINVGYSSKYPFNKMKVGDSFFVPCINTKTGSNKSELSVYHMVLTAAAHYRRRTNRLDQHYTARVVEEQGKRGARIWRDK